MPLFEIHSLLINVIKKIIGFNKFGKIPKRYFYMNSYF